MSRVLVIGASGDVGRGIVAALAEQQWQIVAAARSRMKLDGLFDDLASVTAIDGDLATAEGAERLWSDAAAIHDGLDAVVVSVSSPLVPQRLFDFDAGALAEVLQSNVITHFNAARAMIPRLGHGGVYLGIGGGTADFVPPGGGHLSMCQAALRMFYRAVAREQRQGGVHIRELMIHSMVNGSSCRDVAKPDWLTDIEVGQHVAAILRQPDVFPGPVLALRSRDQVGSPATER